VNADDRVKAVAEFRLQQSARTLPGDGHAASGLGVPRQYAELRRVPSTGQGSPSFFDKLVQFGYATACAAFTTARALSREAPRPLSGDRAAAQSLSRDRFLHAKPLSG